MKKFLAILLSAVLCLTVGMAIGCNKASDDYEVTAEEFVSAITFEGQTNYKITTTNTVVSAEGSEVMTMVVERAGDKIKLTMTDSETEIGYVEKVGDKYYNYSEDGEGFVKVEGNKQIFDTYASVNLASLGIEYADLTYNAETKAYEAATIESEQGEMSEVSFKFEDNKLVSCSMKLAYGPEATATQTVAVVYGDVTVTLPAVE